METEMDGEAIFQVMLEEGDEDASFVQDFEEQVLMTCQDSPELSACFTTYQEVRDRLCEKARTRGYWPLKTGNYSKGKGRSGGKTGKGQAGGLGNNAKRKSLAMMSLVVVVPTGLVLGVFRIISCILLMKQRCTSLGPKRSTL